MWLCLVACCFVDVDYIDIVNERVSGSDYKEEEDPRLYQSAKTGRGPLSSDWRENPPDGIIMCAYKLCKVCTCVDVCV